MPIDFPNTPTLLETFTVGDYTWQWDGSAWRSLATPEGPTGPTGPAGLNGATGPTGAAGPAIHLGTSAPSGPTEGRLWYDSTIGQTFIYYDNSWSSNGTPIFDSVLERVSAKGDILVALNADSVDALNAGSNGQALVVDMAEPVGLKWANVGDVTVSGTQTLSNKTLTDPVINNATINSSLLKSPEEIWSVSATAATGTINIDLVSASAFYFTSNASANWTFNFRGNSLTTLNSILGTGTSATAAIAVTNGGTAYRPTAFQVDGSSVTPKWQNGSAPSSGNANSIDLYVFTIVKTGDATFTVFASQTRFA